MTDISELVKRMRGLAEYVDDCDEAADALEAQAKEIEELKKELNAWHESANWPEKSPGRMRARIAELEAALKPFANAANNFDSMPVKNAEEWFVYSGVLDASGYSGAISVADLRAARNGERG
jgi:uncharacterized protein (DUF305 family)